MSSFVSIYSPPFINRQSICERIVFALIKAYRPGPPVVMYENAKLARKPQIGVLAGSADSAVKDNSSAAAYVE